jgi:hypothetical protein
MVIIIRSPVAGRGVGGVVMGVGGELHPEPVCGVAMGQHELQAIFEERVT